MQFLAVTYTSRQFARSTTFEPRDETIFFAILSATEPMACLVIAFVREAQPFCRKYPIIYPSASR